MLDRRKAVAELLKDRGGLAVVAGLGSPAYDVFAAGDHDLNFYNWGAMGSAAMTGLGLALAQPDRPIAVFTGDGEMLMGLGAFATIAQHQPNNLSIIILDNGHYAETGQQTAATGLGADLAGIAQASGIAQSRTIDQPAALPGLRADIHACAGTQVAVLKIAVADLPRALPLRDGVAIKHRVQQALTGQITI